MAGNKFENRIEINKVLSDKESRNHDSKIDQDNLEGSLPHITIDSLFLTPQMFILQSGPITFKN